MSYPIHQPADSMSSRPNDDLVDKGTSNETIRKTYSYQLEWPSEIEVEKPVYRQSSQILAIAWPGIIAGSAIYALCIFFLAKSLQNSGGFFIKINFGRGVSESILLALAFVLYHVGITSFALFVFQFLVAIFDRLFRELISARRAVLIEGAIALLPVSLFHASWWDNVPWFAIVIILIAGIWIGAYSAVAAAARYGKFTYTQRKPSTSDRLQFRIHHMFWLTAIFAIIAALDRSLPGVHLLLIAGTAIPGFILLILLDREWMKFQGEF